MLYLFKKAIILYARFIHCIDKRCVFNNTFLDINNVLKSNYKQIKKEFLSYKGNISNFEDLSKTQNRIVNKNHWKSIWLKCFNVEVPEIIKHFPVTYNTLKPFKEVSTIMFSVMKPGTVITPHIGPFSGVLRYQHGIIIPKSKKVYIEINGIKKYWKENESIVFDDTFIHNAQNLTKSKRVILFLDILRPLPFPLNFINKVILKLISLTPGVVEIVENSKQFKERQSRLKK